MFDSLKVFAKTNNVPIICDEGLNFITNLIIENNVKSILEIGSAIGYSALSFSMHGCKIDTIERNEEMFNYAKENISKFKKEKDIFIINKDALEVEDKDLRLMSYDLIFIDAAKAQYERFFKKYEEYLNKNGVIVTDNLNFHNLDINKVSRHTRQLIRKLNSFKEFLINNKKYETNIYDIGDGISVSKRK